MASKGKPVEGYAVGNVVRRKGARGDRSGFIPAGVVTEVKTREEDGATLYAVAWRMFNGKPVIHLEDAASLKPHEAMPDGYAIRVEEHVWPSGVSGPTFRLCRETERGELEALFVRVYGERRCTCVPPDYPCHG